MIKELQYTSIKRVLDNIMDHPLLRDVNLDQAIRYTIRFIGLHGYSKLYKDKIEDIDIHDFRGVLPCDLISIIQVKDLATGICLRSMTDNFAKGQLPDPGEGRDPRIPGPPVRDQHPDIDLLNNVRKPWYIPPMHRYREEPAFKTQGRIIYTSFPEGKVGLAYKAIPVDENGYPMLIDNENYLAALEAYIKKQVFTVKFDTGKISAGVLQNAQRDYAVLAAELQSEFITPSVSEMESLTRALNTMISKVREFDNGFTNLGDREWIRRH